MEYLENDTRLAAQAKKFLFGKHVSMYNCKQFTRNVNIGGKIETNDRNDRD